MISPMPAPSTSRNSVSVQNPVLAFILDSRNSPAAVTAVPAIGNSRYLPVLLTNVPLPRAVASRPSTIGSIRSPDVVADTPFTYCRKVGRNVIEPIIAKPTMKLSTEATLNTRLRNNRIGRIGSAARSSTNTKTASATTEPANRAMIVAEPQAYWVPPQDVARVSPVAPSATNRQ